MTWREASRTLDKPSEASSAETFWLFCLYLVVALLHGPVVDWVNEKLGLGLDGNLYFFVLGCAPSIVAVALVSAFWRSFREAIELDRVKFLDREDVLDFANIVFFGGVFGNLFLGLFSPHILANPILLSCWGLMGAGFWVWAQVGDL